MRSVPVRAKHGTAMESPWAEGTERVGSPRMVVRTAISLGLGFALGVGLAIDCASGVAQASRRDWTGSAACGACHPAELAAWQATPHARTRERFASRPESRCLGCHATGEAPAGPAMAIEVGCEACHGAGAAYAEADLMRDRPVAL